jgi:hypothetical protein
LPTEQFVLAEPTYVIAVKGDDQYTSGSNSAPTTGYKWEACSVNTSPGTAGILNACITSASSCQGAGSITNKWALECQTEPNTRAGMANDAMLYFSAVFSFNGLASETSGAGGGTLSSDMSAGERFVLATDGSGSLITDLPNLLTGRQSNSTSFCITRSYYQMLRLMSYVYTIGGTTGTGGAAAGATGTVERHIQ